jgi:hypothetical protein
MDPNKLNALKKVMQDIKDLSDLGEANNDTQISFIAESMKVVLLAGNDAGHAELMAYHIGSFLNELQMLEGDRTVSEHFKQEAICEN